MTKFISIRPPRQGEGMRSSLFASGLSVPMLCAPSGWGRGAGRCVVFGDHARLSFGDQIDLPGARAARKVLKGWP